MQAQTHTRQEAVIYLRENLSAPAPTFAFLWNECIWFIEAQAWSILGNEAAGWKLRFPEVGCFGHVSSRHFRDVVLQCLWIFRNQREGGKRDAEEMNKQQNNFLCEHKFSRGWSFFFFCGESKVQMDKIWDWLPEAEWFVLWSIKACFPNEQTKLFCEESRKNRAGE